MQTTRTRQRKTKKILERELIKNYLDFLSHHTDGSKLAEEAINRLRELTLKGDSNESKSL